MMDFRAWSLIGEGWDYWTLQGLAIDHDISWREYKWWCKSTGLKDKNGREIYEGDILQYKSGKKFITTVVSWDVIEESDGWYTVAGLFFNHHPKEVEIIGNIHENPELLK